MEKEPKNAFEAAELEIKKLLESSKSPEPAQIKVKKLDQLVETKPELDIVSLSSVNSKPELEVMSLTPTTEEPEDDNDKGGIKSDQGVSFLDALQQGEDRKKSSKDSDRKSSSHKSSNSHKSSKSHKSSSHHKMKHPD